MTNDAIIEEYYSFLGEKAFPCVGAKAALGRQKVRAMVAGHMACPRDDRAILDFLYTFIDHYRQSSTSYHSAAIIFSEPLIIHSEELFDALLWQRLQSLHNLDALQYAYDIRVDADPSSPHFSFSLKSEAFFILGLHAAAGRAARRFRYPTLVFNPHAEFEKLRQTYASMKVSSTDPDNKDKSQGSMRPIENLYDRMKNTVRKRDILYSGSVNPMLKDFGESSEVYQYSGRIYDSNWQCPLNINHATTEKTSTTEHHSPT